MGRAASRLTAEVVMDGRVPSSPVLSPDGRWVVFVVTPVRRSGEHTGERALGHGGRWDVAPWRLDIPPAHLSSPRWAADSESVFFLSDHADRGRPQLHRIGRAGQPVVATATATATDPATGA